MNNNVVNLAFCFENNFGDKLNRFLFKRISSKTFRYISYNSSNQFPHLLGIGSILHHANSFSTVWGSGFIGKWMSLRDEPAQIYAVRGPKTREVLLNQSIDCPEVYGDPALLLPLFINLGKIKKKYLWGIVPHYVDQKSSCLCGLEEKDEILILNVRHDIKKFVKDLCSCERIVSSSLHGLIAADAYSIPSVWCEFSNKVIGNGFKFRDYLISVGRKQETAVKINESLSFLLLESKLSKGDIGQLTRGLIESCPLLQKEEKLTFVEKFNNIDNCHV